MIVAQLESVTGNRRWMRMHGALTAIHGYQKVGNMASTPSTQAPHCHCAPAWRPTHPAVGVRCTYAQFTKFVPAVAPQGPPKPLAQLAERRFLEHALFPA